jgi:hypothetical protein
MKATKRILFMIMSIVLIPFLAQADFPVSYQGKLANTDGVPISGTVSNTISLYTVIEGGEAVWSEYHDNVKVENGILNVILGISTDQSQSLFDTLSRHDTLYYSVSINHSEIKPRSRITGVMFAIRAKIADTVKDLAITSDKIKPDAVTSDKIASNAVTELKIEDGAVSSEKIQDDAISSQKIQDGAVTVQKISDADGNLSLNNELKVNKGISIKELPPNYSPPAEQGYGKIYAKKGNSSLRQDIIFNWRLDERTGDHIDDAIGFCDATAYSNLTVVPGKLGMAKLFDGQTDYIQENNNTDLDFRTDNFSVSFWMKAERPSGWSAIMSKANDWIESKDVCGWLFGNRDSGSDTLEFRINSCGQDKEHRITHAENVFNNEWHHIVGIRDSETIKLYVDGVLKDTAYNVSQSVNVNEPFIIGSVINKYFYSGAVDEVAIWKKTLNLEEISDLFNQGNGAAIPDELANLYYKRSDGSEISLIGGNNNIFLHEGNFGIGTMTPEDKFEVKDGSIVSAGGKFKLGNNNWYDSGASTIKVKSADGYFINNGVDITRWTGNIFFYAPNRGYKITATKNNVSFDPDILFKPGNQYIHFNKEDAPVVITVEGSIPGDTHVSSQRPFIRFHGLPKSAVVKIEIKNTKNVWTVLSEDSINNFNESLYLSLPVGQKLVYPNDWPLKGVRYTITSLESHFYIDDIGYISTMAHRDGIPFLTLDDIWVDSNKNVGIGTTEPETKLEVNGIVTSKFEGFSLYCHNFEITEEEGWKTLVFTKSEYNTFGNDTYDSIGKFTVPKNGYYRLISNGCIENNNATEATQSYSALFINASQARTFKKPNFQFSQVMYLQKNTKLEVKFLARSETLFLASWWFQGEYLGK